MAARTSWLPSARPASGVHYKWIALSNTTLGVLMAITYIETAP